jgi:hypothetical protein
LAATGLIFGQQHHSNFFGAAEELPANHAWNLA